MSTSDQPVTGINGYEVYENKTYEPYFTSVLPSNWIVNYRSLTSQDGGWISAQGPFDKTGSRHISLDIQLLNRSNDAIFNSLNDFAQYSLKQESIGTVEVKIDAERKIGNVSGWEYKIIMQRSVMGANGPVNIVLAKQWFIIPRGNSFLCVYFESPVDDFDTYIDVYNKFLAHWELAW